MNKEDIKHHKIICGSAPVIQHGVKQRRRMRLRSAMVKDSSGRWKVRVAPVCA